MPFIQYDLDLEDGMTVKNDTAHLYRYFDATAQAEYLYRCIEETVHHDFGTRSDSLQYSTLRSARLSYRGHA